MNKNLSITLMVFAVIATLSTLFLRHVDANLLNEDFSITTLYGDDFLIHDIFEISNIRQEGSNQFARVVLTENKAEIFPISFDMRHQLDERQLEHREFYRGTQAWQRSVQSWSGNQQMTHFHVLSIWVNHHLTYRILNIETGAITNINPTHKDALIEWADIHFLERDGQLYYVEVAYSGLNASVYLVNFETEQLEHQFFASGETTTDGTWLATEHGLYFYGHNWTFTAAQNVGELPEEIDPYTVATSANPFYRINFETKEIEAAPAPTGITDTWSWARFGNYAVLQGIQATYLEAEQAIIPGFTFVNMESGERHIFPAPESPRGQWIEPSEFIVRGDFLIEMRRLSPFTQEIIIYDFESMEKLYHGRIILRNDQGLIDNGWGRARDFEIHLRDT